jgi:CheY-like chemotaxis protein
MIMRKLIGELLKRFGHKVDFCVDGREALAAVQEKPYDLVLMDVEMPEMNGKETTQAIRAMGHDEEHLPILAVTGHSDPGHLSECLNSGMNDTITKPVTADDLKSLLAKWARRRVTPTDS